jgi:hypothetical protein
MGVRFRPISGRASCEGRVGDSGGNVLLQQECADLIDRRGPAGDQSRPDSMTGLQVELILALLLDDARVPRRLTDNGRRRVLAAELSLSLLGRSLLLRTHRYSSARWPGWAVTPPRRWPRHRIVGMEACLSAAECFAGWDTSRGSHRRNLRWARIVRQPEPLLKLKPCRFRYRLRSQLLCDRSVLYRINSKYFAGGSVEVSVIVIRPQRLGAAAPVPPPGPSRDGRATSGPRSRGARGRGAGVPARPGRQNRRMRQGNKPAICCNRRRRPRRTTLQGCRQSHQDWSHKPTTVPGGRSMPEIERGSEVGGISSFSLQFDPVTRVS